MTYFPPHLCTENRNAYRCEPTTIGSRQFSHRVVVLPMLACLDTRVPAISRGSLLLSSTPLKLHEKPARQVIRHILTLIVLTSVISLCLFNVCVSKVAWKLLNVILFNSTTMLEFSGRKWFICLWIFISSVDSKHNHKIVKLYTKFKVTDDHK